MKKVINRSLVLIAIFASTLGYSSEININKDITKGTKVTFENIDKGTVLFIKDMNGLTLFEEKIKKIGTYSRAFDLTNLPDAEYYFEIDHSAEIKIIPFSIKERVPKFVSGTEYSIVKPEVKVEENFVHISKNSLEEQDLDIKVYYEGSDLAFQESLKEVQTLNRTYDFSSSIKGNYIIVLTTEGRTFVNNINIP